MARRMDEVCIEIGEDTFCILLTKSLWKRWLSIGYKFGFSKLATVQEETHAFISVLLDIADLQTVPQGAVFSLCEGATGDSNTSVLTNESDISLWSQKSAPNDTIELSLPQLDAATGDEMGCMSTVSATAVETTNSHQAHVLEILLTPSNNHSMRNEKSAASGDMALIRNDSTGMRLTATDKDPNAVSAEHSTLPSDSTASTNSANVLLSTSRRRRGRRRRKSSETSTSLCALEREVASQIVQKRTTSGRSVRLPSCLNAYVVEAAVCPPSPTASKDKVVQDEIAGNQPGSAIETLYSTEEDSTSTIDPESPTNATLPARESEGVDRGGGKRRKSPAEVTDHLGLLKPRRGRPKNEPLPCSACGCLITGWLHVQNHYRRQHPGLPLPSKPRKEARYICKQCGESFTKFMFLQSHTEATHTTLEFRCETCRKLFPSNFKLVQHRRVAHKNTSKYICEQCGKEYKSETSLRVHVGSAHQGVRYSCDVCGHTYTSKQHLDAHVAEAHARTHQYVCELCGAAFFAPVRLRRHMALHKDAQLPCSRCGKKFRNATSLRHHQISHSTARNFACPLCNKTFKRHSHLHRHLRLAHQKTRGLDLVMSAAVSVTGQSTSQHHSIDGQSQLLTTSSMQLSTDENEPRVVTLVQSPMSQALTVGDHLQQLMEPNEDASASAFVAPSNICANVQLLEPNVDDTVDIVVVTTREVDNMDNSVLTEM